METYESLLNKVKKVAEIVDGKVYEDYSGRGMYGASCVGISCDDVFACIEQAAKEGLRGAKWNSLGRGYIVYWPGISKPKED
jgi:hypothetical protein